MPAKHSVAVFGGGVGGLSAAHELAERGFAVTVYERNSALGGKARSLSVVGSGIGGRKDLPGEHGFRFFPGFYKHVTDTMSRIPFGAHSGNCRDNLVQATRILLAREGKLDPVWAARFPETLDDFRTAFLALFDNLDIPHHEVAVLRRATAGAGDKLRGALRAGVRRDRLLALHRSGYAIRKLSQIPRSGVDPFARRHARRGDQHAYGGSHPVAALLRHPRARAGVRSPANRADERRLDRSVAKAPERAPGRDARSERDSARVQPDG